MAAPRGYVGDWGGRCFRRRPFVRGCTKRHGHGAQGGSRCRRQQQQTRSRPRFWGRPLPAPHCSPPLNRYLLRRGAGGRGPVAAVPPPGCDAGHPTATAAPPPAGYVPPCCRAGGSHRCSSGRTPASSRQRSGGGRGRGRGKRSYRSRRGRRQRRQRRRWHHGGPSGYVDRRRPAGGAPAAAAAGRWRQLLNFSTAAPPPTPYTACTPFV